MFASRLLHNRVFRHKVCIVAAQICIAVPFALGFPANSTSLAQQQPVRLTTTRKSLESLNEDQVVDLFKQSNFESKMVKEQGLNGMVLATAIDSANDLEKLGFKSLQARSLYRLITKWKTTGLVTDSQDGMDINMCAVSHGNEHGTSMLSQIEFARRESMNNDYYAGRGSDAAAINRLQEAARTDDHLAQAYLAVLYYLGTAHTPNNKEKASFYARCALPWLEQQVTLDCPFSQFALGYFTVCDICNEKSKIEGIILLGMAANRDHAGAMNTLGFCCGEGLLITKDEPAAARYYKAAADLGSAAGQNNYGSCCAHGEGVPVDKAEAVRYYRLAAEQGDAVALNNVAVCYEEGDGVPQDLQEAIRFYKLSADRGYASAQCNLGRCYHHGAGVAKSETEAVRYYKLAALQGNHYAECNLGVCYDKGTGVAANPAEAVRYYNLAVEHGSVDALHNLGLSYFYGAGVVKNEVRAIEYFRRAASLGHETSIAVVKELDGK